MRLRGSLAGLPLFLATTLSACGPDRPGSPLPPPDMYEGLLLEWSVYIETGEGELEPTTDYRFEMMPAGRFSYAWRGSGAEPKQWQALEGTWKKTDNARVWTLHPDAGREAIDEAGFRNGRVPRLKWSGNLYLVPVVDTETRRSTRLLSLVQATRGE